MGLFRQISLCSFIIIIFFLSCKSQKRTSVVNMGNYENELLVTLNKIGDGKRIMDKSVVNLIPKNENQYIVYYSMTFPERSNEVRNAFYQFDSIIIDRANHNYEILDEYIMLSQFVDGDYAESYAKGNRANTILDQVIVNEETAIFNIVDQAWP